MGKKASTKPSSKKRPNEKFEPEIVAEAIRKASGIQAAAARMLKCDRDTVARYIREHDVCRQAYEEANEVQLDIAEARLAEIVNSPGNKDHFKALRFYLRTKGRRRGYVERQEVENVGTQPITLIIEPVQPKED